MSNFNESSFGAKILAASGVGLLISFGLCGLGSGLADRSSALGGLATTLGFGLFLGCVIVLGISILTALIAAFTRNKD